MKFSRIFIGLFILAGCILAVVSWRFSLFWGPGGEAIVFEVGRGENFVNLSHRLETQSVIKNRRLFRWYVNILPPKKPLQRGEFALQKNMGIAQVLKVLTEGKPIEYKFTVPEGHNIYQISESLAAAGFVKSPTDFLEAARAPEVVAQLPTNRPAAAPPTSIEGYLYPDTYKLQKIYTAREIAIIMLNRFKEVYKTITPEISVATHIKELGMSAHDIVTLASIVEKETGAAMERPLIASVFLNRLSKRMRLQTDPTIIYGILHRDGRFDGNIRRKDIHHPTPYNTYVIYGLPPGPIASPGLNALKAVLNPAQSDFFFFVSRNNGTHIFTRDFRDHQKAIRETQLAPASRNGKSWRDLPKEQRAN